MTHRPSLKPHLGEQKPGSQSRDRRARLAAGLSRGELPVVSLRRLFPQASFVGCADIRVRQATEQSARCTLGSLFAAVPGTRLDGAHYVPEAIRRGASSLLVQHPLADAPVPQCVVPNVRRAYAQICSELAGQPCDRLNLAAVTGTNGKTTVTWLLRSIYRAADRQSGLLGTIEYSDGAHTCPAALTTPDAATLWQWLGRMVACGTTHAAVELSSHALHQDRCAGIRLDAAVVTNVTQDHFDYHDGFEAYLASKARIFDHGKPNGLVVLNGDDAGAARLREQAAALGNLVTYGLNRPADVTAEVKSEDCSGSRFVLRLRASSIEISTPLVGRHNVSNCLAAAAVAEAAGIPPAAIVAGIEALASVPGRLERIDCGQPFHVFVDYAHTDDALRHALECLNRLTSGRVICVFGAGGDRDRSKRPLLGKAAMQADVAVVTNDNPRTEDPQRIAADILSGCERGGRMPYVELDRASAIRWALREARPGDSVLIAGKGHEREQVIGTEGRPFDDRCVARESLLETNDYCATSGPALAAHGAEAKRGC